MSKIIPTQIGKNGELPSFFSSLYFFSNFFLLFFSKKNKMLSQTYQEEPNIRRKSPAMAPKT